MKTIAICTIIAASIAAFQVADLCKQNYIKAEQAKADRVLAVQAKKAEQVLALQMKIADIRNTKRILAASPIILPPDPEREALSAESKIVSERLIAEYQTQIDAIQGFVGTPQPNFPNTKLAQLADESEAALRR